MSLGNIQAVGIFLVLVLPGFVWTRTENIFQPKHRISPLELLATGLTRSLVVNSLLMFVVWAFARDKSFTWFKQLAADHPALFLGSVSLYVLGAFGIAFLAGYLRGALHSKVSFQGHLQRVGLTHHSEATSVWEDAVVHESFAPDIPPEGAVRAVWVLVTYNDGSELFGRIASYPQVIEKDKPFWFSITEATDEPDADGKREGRYGASHVVMINSPDVRNIAVHYSNEEPVTPTIPRNHLIVVLSALVKWWPLWVAATGLITGIVLVYCAYP